MARGARLDQGRIERKSTPGRAPSPRPVSVRTLLGCARMARQAKKPSFKGADRKPRAAIPRAAPRAVNAARVAERAGVDAFSELLASVRVDVDRRLRALWDAKILSLKRHGPDVTSIAGAARDLTLR